MQDTKQKIIAVTIGLFNQYGFANVSLPHIAKELGISLGNLTYHFPKKDQLVWGIFDNFVEDLNSITKGYELEGMGQFQDLRADRSPVLVFHDPKQGTGKIWH